MQNKNTIAERNIEKLLNLGFNTKYQPDTQLREDTLKLLEQRVVTHNSKAPQPGNTIVAGLTVVWIAFACLIFFGLKTSIYLLDIIKSAVGLSLVLIPVSSIVLIILKWKVYEKNRV